VIEVDKQLSPDFLLVMKHNSAFAGVLDRLVRRLPVYAVVRNPLSILSSWQRNGRSRYVAHWWGSRRDIMSN